MSLFSSGKPGKKPEETRGELRPSAAAGPLPIAAPPRSAPPPPPAPSAVAAARAPEKSRETVERKGVITIIGQEITIKGELLGDGDVTLEGRVEGKIVLKKNLIVGEKGHVEADVHASTVTISGKVIGNVFAESKVEIVATGFLEGNIHAPKIVIAEGAHFKGSVDMSDRAKKPEAPPAPPKEAPPRPAEKPPQLDLKPAAENRAIK
jgi:cytoskeletal protein CcmA (bactofilin family)